MTCYVTDNGFICGNLGPQCDCGRCADYFCDYPVGHDKTCDRPLCERCTDSVAPDTDYCRDHSAEWQKFIASGGVTDVLENVVPFPRKDAP